MFILNFHGFRDFNIITCKTWDARWEQTVFRTEWEKKRCMWTCVITVHGAMHVLFGVRTIDQPLCVCMRTSIGRQPERPIARTLFNCKIVQILSDAYVDVVKRAKRITCNIMCVCLAYCSIFAPVTLVAVVVMFGGGVDGRRRPVSDSNDQLRTKCHIQGAVESNVERNLCLHCKYNYFHYRACVCCYHNVYELSKANCSDVSILHRGLGWSAATKKIASINRHTHRETNRQNRKLVQSFNGRLIFRSCVTCVCQVCRVGSCNNNDDKQRQYRKIKLKKLYVPVYFTMHIFFCITNAKESSVWRHLRHIDCCLTWRLSLRYVCWADCCRQAAFNGWEKKNKVKCIFVSS